MWIMYLFVSGICWRVCDLNQLCTMCLSESKHRKLTRQQRLQSNALGLLQWYVVVGYNAIQYNTISVYFQERMKLVLSTNSED